MSEHTQLPWIALEGDTFNPERPWGVSRYLSKENCEAIDGDDATWPSRTEVIAEIMSGPDGLAEADAKFIAKACNAHEELLAAMRECITDSGARCMMDESRNAAHICRRRLDEISRLATAAIAKAQGE